jgi:drug/metabolite transporter (DMT)-like permease
VAVTARQVGLLAALAAIWGGSFLLIKYALEGFSAPMIVWARTAIGALLLLLLMRGAVRGALADMRGRPGWAGLLGLLAMAAPFLLVAFGELEVRSGLAAVLIVPAALFVAAFAPLIDPSERIDLRQGAGLAIGLTGVALLVGIESVQSPGEFLGALAMVAAAASYALSSFVVKRRYRRLTPLQTTFVSITAATLITLPAAALTAPTEPPGLRALAALATLGAVGTALAFAIFYKLIAEIGAGRAALASYLAPAAALLYGAILLDEPITVAAIGGLALILAGVALATRSRRPTRAPTPATGEPAYAEATRR